MTEYQNNGHKKQFHSLGIDGRFVKHNYESCFSG